MLSLACIAAVAGGALALPASEAVFLDMYDSRDCSGDVAETVELSSSDEDRCTQCWDRCSHNSPENPGHNSYVLRGRPGAAAAVNGNCVGRFRYSGGWSDESMGGIVRVGGGCHQGGGSAVALCSGTVQDIQDDLNMVCGATPSNPPPPFEPIGAFQVLHPEDYSQHLGEDSDWAEDMVPYIDYPDRDIMTAYYYRWRMYRKHIKWTKADGFIVTEFLPYVTWAGTHNTIPAAAGHQILEGRWLHDARVIDNVTLFWTNGHGDPTSYTNWIGYAALHRYRLTGDLAQLSELLPGLVSLYRGPYVRNYLRSRDGSKIETPSDNACWFQDDGRDAMEVSISGSGCRPTIAAAMWAEASAIVEIAKLVGGDEAQALQKEFGEWQAFSAKVVRQHWNPNIDLFAVIPLESSGGGSATNASCDLKTVRVPNATVDVRELLGYVPWYFDGLLSEADSDLLPAWNHLFDDEGFQAKYGLRSAERRHACYNFSFDHGDCWNGPSWPYETSRVLTAAGNVLRSVDASPHVTHDRYFQLLQQYAKQHTITTAVNDTANPLGSGHIFENLHPDLGYWNNRAQMYWREDRMRDMGNDYDHSTFCDLVLSGLLGIVPQLDNSLVVDPLTPLGVTHFAADHVRYQGHNIAVIWDHDGTVYGKGSGLSVIVDGSVVASSEFITKLTVPLGTAPTPAPVPPPHPSPTPQPDGCEQRCAAEGHCCMGSISSYQHPSCAMGCTIAKHTRSLAECQQTCRDNDNTCGWSIDGIVMDNCQDCPSGCDAGSGIQECLSGCIHAQAEESVLV